MAIVPVFEREDLPAPMQTGAQADIQAAGIPGAALSRLGQEGIDTISDIIHQENYDYSQTTLASQRVQATDEYLKGASEAQRTGNYAGFASGIKSNIVARAQQAIAGAPTPRAADFLTKQLASLQDEFATKSSVFEAEGMHATAKANVGTTLKMYPTIAYRDPSQLNAVLNEGKGIINGAAAAGLTEAERVDMLQDFTHTATASAVQGGLDGNNGNTASGMMARIKNGEFDSRLSEPQLIQLQQRGDEIIKRQQAEAQRQANENALMVRGSVESAFQDNLASIRDTGKPAVQLSPGQIAAAYPHDPERVQGMVQAQEREAQGYVARQNVALSSPDEDAATLHKFTPQGPGYTDQASSYNDIRAAILAKQKAIGADPAAYVQTISPQVHQLFQAAQADPSQMSKAVAAQDAMYDHLGVAPDNRPVLAQNQAAAIVARFSGADPAQKDVGAALDTMAKSYGAAWPRVYADLVQAKLPAQYEMLATMDTPQQAAGRQDLQRAITTAAQKGGTENLEKLAPPTASTAIKTGLPDMMAEFQKTAVIPGASLNADLMTKLSNSISLLAHSYTLQGQDGPTALKNAYDALIGSKYDFDGTMRVPKGMLPDVHAATDQLLASIKPADLNASARQLPDVAADRWTSAKQNSTWYPTRNDDGLMLMVQDRAGRWNRVFQADGKTPVQILFKNVPKAQAVGADTPLADSPGSTVPGP